MARNSNGDYVVPSQIALTETVTPADAITQVVTDLGAALTNSVARDGSGAALADLPMGGFRHTGAGLASARDQYATVGQTQDQAFTWCGQATGAANALTLSPSPAIPAYALGQVFAFSGCETNTGPVTLSVSGLAPLPLRYKGEDLPSGFLQNCGLYRALYDGTRFQLEVLSTRPAGTVKAVDLADGAVTSSALADGSVITPKLAHAAVTDAKLADGVVSTAKLADGSVSTAKLADAATTTSKLADGSVTSNKIAPAAVTASQVTFGTFGPVREKGVNTNLIAADMGILWNEAGGITLTLPLPQSVTDKAVGIRHKGGTGFVSLRTPAGYIDISGVAEPTTTSLTLRSAGDVVWLTSLGTHWLVIQEHRPVLVRATAIDGTFQEIESDTQVPLRTGNVTLNRGEAFDASTSRFTVPYTGTYEFSGCGTFEDVTQTRLCYMALRVDGAFAFAGTHSHFPGLSIASLVSAPLPTLTTQLIEDQFVEFVLFHNTKAVQRTRDTAFSNWISIRRVGDGA